MNEGTPSTHGDNRFDAERFVSQKTEGNKRGKDYNFTVTLADPLPYLKIL